jgi:opacity protein-like surface antigen
MKKSKNIALLSALLLAQSTVSFAAQTDDMFGMWSSITLQGDFKFVSPDAENVKWLVSHQNRIRDQSNEMRTTDNLSWGQVGYQLNEHASFWIGYLHDFNNPLNKPDNDEHRPYQDFLWNQDLGDFKFMARTRLEERINQTTGDAGYRPRQLIQVSHDLPFVEHLSAYVGDEVLLYVNQNKFGKQGFSENRALAGLSYQFTPKAGADIGYLGQYLDMKAGDNTFTHNLQVNLRYKF